MSAPVLDHEVVIVGSGFSGLGCGVALDRIGVRDFVILEREAELGGTWVQHDYPGLEVDMPFFIYSYPFEVKPDWEHVYPTGREMRDYTRHCAERYDLVRRTRCRAAVERAAWDEAESVWRVRIASGEELVCRYLVNATGLLVTPKDPGIPGLDAFAGKRIHTARWDWDYDLDGKRVAVVGTGASAIQIVPAICERTAQLDVYQRTPIWLLPKPNPALSRRVQEALRRFPVLHTALRWASNLAVEIAMGLGMIRYTRFPWIFDAIERSMVKRIREEVDDPALQEALIPDYSFFCKRPSFSDTFYAALGRDDVTLVTDPIERVTADGVVTADGREHPADAIVLATGYEVFNRRCMPGYPLLGCGGVDLGELWERERFQAYEGASVPGFPNLFLFMGPYSAAGASYFTMIDTQSKHLVRCLREARRRGANRIEVDRTAHERDFAKVRRRRESTVLFGGQCATSRSYYFDEHGDSPGLRPVTGFEHFLNSRFFPLRHYHFESRGVS